MMVWPSAAAIFAASEAMMPLAPGLLSTTTGWPQACVSFWLTSRAMMSVAPPGAKGMMKRIGLDG